MNLRPTRCIPILIIGVAAPLFAPAPAPAQPIDDLREQAAKLTTEIEEQGAQVAALGEQINAAQIRFDEAQAKITDAQGRIDAAEDHIDELRLRIADRAAAIYRTAGTGGPLEAIEVDDANDAGLMSQYTDAATAKDDALVEELAAAKADLERERAEAEEARLAAEQERDALAAAKAEADAAAADLEGLLADVEGDIAAYVAEEQARREAALAAAPPKPNPQSAPPPTSPESSGPPPVGNGGAGAAVGYAWAQVGKPYCYAGTGPDCFDCSGLTMMAWAAGGVSLPHNSGAQAAATTPISTSEMQPGDLITTSSWGAHVGIWVGGGYIHATHTGSDIKFIPGAGSVVDARRVT